MKFANDFYYSTTTSIKFQTPPVWNFGYCVFCTPKSNPQFPSHLRYPCSIHYSTEHCNANNGKLVKCYRIFGYSLMKMIKQMLACCKMYISESRNREALEAIEMAAKLFRETHIINKFEDVPYNRVGYTLVSKMGPSPNSCPLKKAAFEMVEVAFQVIDFGRHYGSHPRLGVVDHICFHPLVGVSLDHVAGTAKSLATDVGSKLQVATYLYGSAHNEGRSLDSLRRELGYFKPNATGNELVGRLKSETLPLNPDEGPPHTDQKTGIVVIGATRWVDNYNVPLFCDDMTKVQKIARKVSGRGGGLNAVQSVALAHGKGIIEVACNLLDTSKASGKEVQAEVERLGREEGLEVGEGYYTDLSQEKIVEKYLKLADSSDL